MKSARLGGLLAAISLAGAPLVAIEDGPEPEPGVTIRHENGATRLEAAPAGRVVSYAIPRSRDGRREIVLLLAPRESADADAGTDDSVAAASEEGSLPPCPADPPATVPRPMSLVRIDREGSGALVEIRSDLPGDATALDAADLDGDGAEELIVARPGALLRVGGERVEPLLEDPGLAWSELHPRAVRRPRLGGAAVAFSTVEGRLRVFGPAEGGSPWRTVADVALPLAGSAGAHNLVVRYPIPDLVGRRADGAWLFVTAPAAVGRQRLRMELIAVLPSGATEFHECWARLPAPEDVLERHFVLLDDRPALLVTTKPADKLAIFGEKALRLYALERDRSRRGVDPLFAAESGLNLWQEATPAMVDANGDGREDLVIGYWKGLFDERVVLDVYPRADDGSFDRVARATAFDVKDGDRSFVGFGHDLDGDGLGDLVLRDKERWLLYRGRASAKGGDIVERKAHDLRLEAPADGRGEVEVTVGTDGTRIWGLAGIETRPRFVDLDGDGTSELLWVDGDGLRWVRLDGRGS